MMRGLSNGLQPEFNEAQRLPLLLEDGEMERSDRFLPYQVFLEDALDRISIFYLVKFSIMQRASVQVGTEDFRILMSRGHLPSPITWSISFAVVDFAPDDN